MDVPLFKNRALITHQIPVTGFSEIIKNPEDRGRLI